MATSPLGQKLRIKPGHRLLLLNPPEGYRELFEPLPDGAELAGSGGKDFDCVFLFVKNVKELSKHVSRALKAVKPDGLLWIAYPKISAKTKSDLTRDVGWDVVTEAGWGIVAIIAVDETWSAGRFRPTESSTPSRGTRASAGHSINRSKTLEVPVSRAFAAWQDGARRRRWLSDAVTIHKATPDKSVRITWSDGSKSIDVGFYPKGDARCQVTVQHSKLPDVAMAERMKAYWGECLDRMKQDLEK